MDIIIGLAPLGALVAYWVKTADQPVGSRRELALLSTILGTFVGMGAAVVLPSSKNLLGTCTVGLVAVFAGTVIVSVRRRKRETRALQAKLQAQRIAAHKEGH
jgi:heme A synthase